jgi:hypothetical protein
MSLAFACSHATFSQTHYSYYNDVVEYERGFAFAFT